MHCPVRSEASRCKESSMICAWRTALCASLETSCCNRRMSGIGIRQTARRCKEGQQRGDQQHPRPPPESRRRWGVWARVPELAHAPSRNYGFRAVIYRPRVSRFWNALSGVSAPAPRDGAFLPRTVTHIPVATLRTVAHILATQQQ